ncbi:MAG: TVP38/TMEM64 family protein [Clostridiales bacterium]|nr:TVP38/TMEM64 family protein [Clostridiales bacterium]
MKEKIKKLFDKNTTHGKIMRLVLIVLCLALVFAVGIFILKITNLWEKVNSIEKIRKIVERGGVFSVLIFLIFQILQTTILQIPAFIVTIAGALVFGKWEAFFLSYFAVMIGSVIMFVIGRKAGKGFLNWIVGKEESEKWQNKMSHGKYLYFLMMFFPVFPDDILCVVAGMTNMSFKFFFWTNVLARGVGILCTVFFGSGSIIPFHGWGLIVWAVILIFIGILFFLSVKFQDKIDETLKQLFSKKKKESGMNDNSDKDNINDDKILKERKVNNKKENKKNL